MNDESHREAGPLDGIRVIEFGSALTNYCGKLFAELGADVVLVEPPEGSDLRRQPPFVEADDGTTERSVNYFFHNTSKRSVVLDLAHPEARAVVERMVASSDLVLDGYPPGELDRLGIGFDHLAEANPTLVMTSVSPFGQNGPYAHYAHSDLVCSAFGGLLWMGGYADGPPVRPPGEQAYMAGALFAAVSSMIALTHAELAGIGQHVDVSVQEAVTMGLENAAQFYDLQQHVRRRFGGTQREAGFGVFPCRDGHVILLASGIGGDRFWASFVEWMEAAEVEGAATLREPGWGDSEFMITEAAKNEFWNIFTSYSLGKTKHDLYHEAHRWRVPLGPVNQPSDIYASAQLRARDYFVSVEAFGREVELPGAPYQLSETPWQMSGAAPRLGEHTAEVLAEHGVVGDELERLFTIGAAA
jgi:benzylsuccinate CoA-transferase BbsE subunit